MLLQVTPMHAHCFTKLDLGGIVSLLCHGALSGANRVRICLGQGIEHALQPVAEQS